MLHETAGATFSTPTAALTGAAGDRAERRHGRLALALQEILTATVRLRAGRQTAADADAFRAHAKHVLAAAERDAMAAGYSGDDVWLARFAAVAFLDESVLNSGQLIFQDWARRPLQEELFGSHLAGEAFFKYLRQLLERADSPELADLLEVFQLCLLLGFQGRFNGSGQGGELHAFTQRTGEKVARIRGPLGELSAGWRPPAEELGGVPRDPWVRRLALIAGGSTLLAALLFAVFHFFTLAGPLGELRALAVSR
jgi:type VI secretion system protein ImpK